MKKILIMKLKDLSKKCFAISRIEDEEYIKKISNYSWKNTKVMLIYKYIFLNSCSNLRAV